MGRHNHENNVAVPGYGKPVVLSGDDSFVNNPAQSQLYSYIADDSDAVWNDEGDLWAFVSDTAGFNDYDDFAPGSTQSVHRQLREGAEGHRDGPEAGRHRADGGGRRLPATAEHRLADDANGVGIDGPQWVLEHWSDLQHRRSSSSRGSRTWPTTSGRACRTSSTSPTPAAAPAAYAAARAASTNGRIWKMVLDRNDPTKVTSLLDPDRR